MSENSTILPVSKSQDRAAALITLPIISVVKAVHMFRSAVFGAPVTAPKQVLKTEPAATKTTYPNKPTLRIASRVHSEIIQGRAVNFYLYGREEVVEVKCRINGVQRELRFSKALADELAVAFTIYSASEWIKRVGFDQAVARASKPKQSVEAKPQPPFVTDIEEKSSSSTTSTPASVPAVSQKTSDRVKKPLANHSSTPIRKRPFEGHIVSFGEQARKDPLTGRSYTTYVMRLENPRFGARDFIGEQLAELVEKLHLEKGQMVKLHSLGKMPFEVEEEGEIKYRHRNEYAIDLI